jgi:hypothetical protein
MIFISLDNLSSSWLVIAANAKMKQAVIFCNRHLTAISVLPECKPWCHGRKDA